MLTNSKRDVSFKSESIDSGDAIKVYDESQVLDLSTCSILIVEDEPSCCQYLKAALKRTKAILFWAKDGQSAVDFMRNNEKINIVLMDIKLPVMNGYRATELIKMQFPEIPIIAQTAYALPGDREKCFEVGCDDYLSKPFSTFKLYNVIHNQLNKIPR